MRSDLFPQSPRRPRRVLMHVVDAMGCESKTVQMECRKCGHRTDWIAFDTFTETKRVPCPTCNGGENDDD
jgi:Zn finger protein HypA/HybF involved in hydrogenase expression